MRVLAAHQSRVASKTNHSEREGNMKLAKYMFVVALLIVPFTAQLHAQTLVAAVAGSSALWTEAGQGAFSSLGCAWTDKNTTTNTFVTDVRSGVGSAQDFGKIWVAWTNTGSCASPTAAAQVYAYISLDSGIGNRCLFAQPQCKLTTNDAAGTAGSNNLPGVTDTALPSGVLSAFNNKSISVAATDIMPLDAAFAAYQALGGTGNVCGALSSGTQYEGYGRGGWPGPGTQVQAQDGSAVFNVIGFNITGTDPFTGTAVPAYTVTPVGATPVLIFVNTGNATGFGAAGVSNVDRATLGLYFTNILVRTQDAIAQVFGGLTNANYAGITAWHRESLSGTYNVFDRAIPNNKELYRTQEQVCPPVEPLNYSRTISDGGTSTTSANFRAIGTGDMITQVQSTNDSIGYAFWSAGNFKAATYGSGTAGALKYLTVDGVDPLCSTYGCGGSAGEIPTATNTFLSNVSLNNVANGSYPIWSELRFVSTSSAGLTAAQTLASYAQSESTTPGGAQPDFITAPNLNVIHAHFALPFVNDAFPASEGPRVCGAGSGSIEAGGDAGGIVTSLQAGSDYAVAKSDYGTSSCTGITNAASFGTHQ
jgi:ABC-type phosphate transport system substrate-binding protein